jgi:hypothetical protein
MATGSHAAQTQQRIFCVSSRGSVPVSVNFSERDASQTPRCTTRSGILGRFMFAEMCLNRAFRTAGTR